MNGLLAKILRLFAVSVVVLALSSVAHAEPQIHVTVVPKAGVGGEALNAFIEGTVSGVKPADYWVVIYSQSDRGVWYLQPFENSPYTTVQDDRHWRARIHSGMVYAALLVKKDSVCKVNATDNDCFKPLTQVGARPSVRIEVEVPGQ